MESKLYYTKEELMAIPHFNFVDIDTNLYLNQKNGDFEIFKKLYLLKKNATLLIEIYVGIHTYLTVRCILEDRESRWMNEYNAYVFYSIKDYMKCLDEANKNRLF